MALVATQGFAAEDYRAEGYTFILKQEAGRCVVSFTGTEHSGRLTLAPAPPCQFVRNESGGLKYFKYNDVGVDAVIIVIGSPLTDDERRRWKDAEGLFCGKTTQALLVRPQGVLVSSEIMRGGVVCATSGVDEKRFYQFAHPIKERERTRK
jgi:hypothetical protein